MSQATTSEQPDEHSLLAKSLGISLVPVLHRLRGTCIATLNQVDCVGLPTCCRCYQPCRAWTEQGNCVVSYSKCPKSSQLGNDLATHGRAPARHNRLTPHTDLMHCLSPLQAQGRASSSSAHHDQIVPASTSQAVWVGHGSGSSESMARLDIPENHPLRHSCSFSAVGKCATESA
jgi:hypothetical protein